MALEQYTEAASTAVIIARDQQVKGDYKKAREILFGMGRDLKIRGIRNPAEMSSSLLLLHSYLLGKSQNKSEIIWYLDFLKIYFEF